MEVEVALVTLEILPRFCDLDTILLLFTKIIRNVQR